MPAITFTVVAATDTLTAVAHGLTTGDRCRVRSVGGTLAAPLAPVVDVFAIRLTVDTLKLATSNALALAGTPIDITTAGTGTQTLEYGLPYCIPNVIAGAGTQVKSADMNGVWAALVALYALLTGQAQAIWSFVTLAVGLVMGANQNITVSGIGDYKHGDKQVFVQANAGVGLSGASTLLGGGTTWSCGAAAVVVLPVPLMVGCRIRQVDFWYQRGTGTVSFALRKAPLTTGTAAPIQTTSIATGTTMTSISLSAVNYTLLNTEQYLLEFAAGGGTELFQGALITYDRP